MFDIHGDLKIEYDRNIFSVTLTGPFNDAGVEHWTRELKKQIEYRAYSEFFVLMNNIDYAGFTPDGYLISDEFNLWLSEQPMVAKAIVQPSKLARKINVSNIPSLARQRIEYFDTKESALDWLRTRPEYLEFESL